MSQQSYIMKLSTAASFSGLISLITIAFTVVFMRPGLRLEGVLLQRQEWLTQSTLIWSIGWWLWLIAIFGWMVLLVTLMWGYSPAHRVPTMLQSGLIIISAILAIIGVAVWMNLLIPAAAHPDASGLVLLVDRLALSMIASACFMGGAVTAWLGIDLIRLKKLPGSWLYPGVIAGLFLVPAPFLLPKWPEPLLIGALFWLIWCLFLAIQRSAPKVYTEWL